MKRESRWHMSGMTYGNPIKNLKSAILANVRKPAIFFREMIPISKLAGGTVNWLYTATRSYTGYLLMEFLSMFTCHFDLIVSRMYEGAQIP